MRKLALLMAVAALSVAPTAQAANITITTGGTNYQTTALTGYATSGNDMNGMLVTAQIQNGSTIQTLTRAWGHLYGSSYGVNFGGSWDDFNLVLGATEDTYDVGAWDFSFSYDWTTSWRLLSLSFDGTTGKTVFDRYHGGTEGTPGSANGRDFSGFDNWNGNITATYLNAVGLGNASPVGDIYAGFAITFSPALSEDGWKDYHFTLDTDNAVTDVIPSVPEPTSLLLLGTGLIGLAAAARRHRR